MVDGGRRRWRRCSRWARGTWGGRAGASGSGAAAAAGGRRAGPRWRWPRSPCRPAPPWRRWSRRPRAAPLLLGLLGGAAARAAPAATPRSRARAAGRRAAERAGAGQRGRGAPRRLARGRAQPPVTGWRRPPRWGRSSQRSMRSSTGWCAQRGDRQPTRRCARGRLLNERDRLVQVHRARRARPTSSIGASSSRRSRGSPMSGRKNASLTAAAELVEVDQHDERRDAARSPSRP